MPETNLPPGIPDNLKEFIRCTSDDVSIAAGDLTWVPAPEIAGQKVPGTAGLTFENGPTAGTIKITVTWGFFSVPITASIVDGKLNVEAPPIPVLGTQITEWVNNFNSDLETCGRQLDEISIRDGQLHFSKAPLAAGTEQETSGGAGGGIYVTGGSPGSGSGTVGPADTSGGGGRIAAHAGNTPVPPDATTPELGAAPGAEGEIGLIGGSAGSGSGTAGSYSAGGSPSVPGPQAGSKTGAFLDDWKGKAAVGAGALAIGVAAFFIFVDDGQPPVSPTPPAAGAVVAPASDNGSPSSDESSTGGSEDSSGTETDATETDDPTGTDSDTSTDTDTRVGGVFDELEELRGQFGFAGTELFVQVDAPNDQTFCGPNESIGADVAGLVAYRDGDMISVGVSMAQMPTTSLDQFSWAVMFQPESLSGYRMFLAQVHNGEETMGEQLEDGTMAPDSDVQIGFNDYGVIFTFPHDPNDPMAYGFAQAFNLPADGDNIGCDQAYAAVTPSPAPSSDTIR